MVAGAIKVTQLACETMQAYDRFEARQETKHTEVLLVPAYPSQENTERILGCGARACVTKPLDLDALLREVGICLVSVAAGRHSL